LTNAHAKKNETPFVQGRSQSFNRPVLIVCC